VKKTSYLTRKAFSNIIDARKILFTPKTMIKLFFRNISKYMLGFLIAVFSLTGIFFAYDLVFDDDLLTVFDDLEDQYTETEFIVDGNEFAGLVFWQATEELDDDVVIDLAGETEDLTCHYQVRGLYLNPQRGNRLRPLDAESLAALTGIDDGSYDNLELT